MSQVRDAIIFMSGGGITMQTLGSIVTLLSAEILLLIGYCCGSSGLFAGTAIVGIPLWLVCVIVATVLLVVTGDQLRRSRRG